MKTSVKKIFHSVQHFNNPKIFQHLRQQQQQQILINLRIPIHQKMIFFQLEVVFKSLSCLEHV